MDLDTPLGLWYPVPRHTWFHVYRSEHYIYWRTETQIQRMIASPQTGFYTFDTIVDTIPLHSYPIMFQVVGDSIWSHRRYAMGTLQQRATLPPGLTIVDSIQGRSVPNLLIASDASVHLQSGVMTCAWMISQDIDHEIRACYHIRDLSSLSSYRGELEGIYRALKHTHIRGLTPERIELWCDNQASIDKLPHPLQRPSDMIQPEADIILATQLCIKQLTHTTVSLHHVYGHQDTRSRDRSELDSPATSRPDSPTEFNADLTTTPSLQRHKQLSRPAQLNIICDEIANETARHVMDQSSPSNETLGMPLPGSKAIVQIGTKWITSKLDHHLLRAVHSNELRRYCRVKYGWPYTTLDAIAWEVIRLARAKRSKSTMMHTSKIMHGWLPVMHMHGHSTGVTQCPGCPNVDETLDHLLQCPHPLLVEARKDGIRAIFTKGKELRLPHRFLISFIRYIRLAIDGTRPRPLEQCSHAAYKTQNRIGPLMLLRGFIAQEWIRLLVELGVDKAERKAALLVCQLWESLVTSIWKIRNRILHDNTNFTAELTHTQLGDRLLWYLQHQDVLSREDRQLARYTREEVEAMDYRTMKAWIRHLDVARDAWTRERAILETGQRLITQFFQRVM